MLHFTCDCCGRSIQHERYTARIEVGPAFDPDEVSPEDLDKLMDDAERGANARLSVDLAKQEITGPDGGSIKFDIDPFRKHCLLNGLDDIGLTMEKKASIDTYEAKLKKERAWA